MIILQKIAMHSSRAKIILELSKKQTLGHGLQSSALLQSTFALLSSQVAVENADNFSEVSMDDEEREPNWTGNSDITNPFESSDEEESNEAVEKQQIAYDQVVIGERSEKVNVDVEEQQEEESAAVAEHEIMVLPRKRKFNPMLWERNVRKLKRLKGDEYINCTGITIQSKRVQPSPCIQKSNHESCLSFSENQRKLLFDNFYQLGSIEEQRSFIASSVKAESIELSRTKNRHSRRPFTNKYSFSVNGQRIKVCKEFFMATLNVTDALIRSSLHTCMSEGVQRSDRRGQHQKGNQLDKARLRFVEEHIASFPAKESHYCRKSSKKRYLDQNLNISKMHTLYVKKCDDLGMLPVKYEVYRKIFAQFNIGFFQPKKDQCSTCTKYQHMNAEEKETFQHEFDDHLKRKDLARSHRDTDKFASKNNSKVLSFNFDLQAVLSTPKSDAGQIFYKRKLSAFFT